MESKPEIIRKSYKSKTSVPISRKCFIREIKGDITSNYITISKIGEGGFGKIYKVKNKESNDIRAMKQVEKAKLPNIETFKNEIAILRALDHPNIIRLFEVFEDEKFIYLIIEFCGGGTLNDKLKQKLKKGKTFSESQAAKIFKQLISAITYCHENGFCHRDLKPENVMFLNNDEDSPIKVIDFGFSVNLEEYHNKGKNVDKLTQSDSKVKVKKDSPLKKMTSKVGTAYYVSPEILKGSYDEKCDVWACGIILYVLIFGALPFSGKTNHDLYKNISKVQNEKFEIPNTKKLSFQLKELLTGMICPANQRLSSKEVLENKWVEIKAKDKKSDLEEFNPENLLNYQFYNRLKKAVLIFIASRLQSEEGKSIKQFFELMDRNKNGKIGISDFIYGLDMSGDLDVMTRKDVEELFYSVDTNHSGVIEYTEFLAAGLDKKIYLMEEKLKEAYRTFDADDSGVISKDDIIKSLGIEDNPNAEELAKEYIEENDYNNDGVIDFQDFTKMMQPEMEEIINDLDNFHLEG